MLLLLSHANSLLSCRRGPVPGRHGLHSAQVQTQLRYRHDLSITYLGKGSPRGAFIAVQWQEGQRVITVVPLTCFSTEHLSVRLSAQLATTWCGRPGASAAPLTEVCPEVEVLSSEEPRRVTRETSVTGSMGRSSHWRS